MPKLLKDDEIDSELPKLAGWEKSGKAIEKNFKVKDFAAALDLVNRIGAEAEKMDHHPDLFLHDWNQVKVTLSTHSEGGITDNDIQLAGRIEAL